jgi:hypothetical protein
LLGIEKINPENRELSGSPVPVHKLKAHFPTMNPIALIKPI